MSLYVVFYREEDPLVDMFVIEMLVVMIESLKLAHRDDKSLGMYCRLTKEGPLWRYPLILQFRLNSCYGNVERVPMHPSTMQALQIGNSHRI